MTETGYFRVIIDKKDEQIEEIEKRNAELKDNLTKAKEIIKNLSNAYEYVIQHKEYADRDVLTKAEQFLKE